MVFGLSNRKARGALNQDGEGRHGWSGLSLSCQPDIQVEMVSRELDTKFKGEVKARDTHLGVVQAWRMF